MKFKNDFITKTKLELGAFYLIKDGRIICYMGQNVNGDYVFIETVSTVIVEDWENREIHIQNEELFMPAFTQCADLIKNNPDKLEEKCILSYKNIPQIYGKLDYIPVIEDVKQFMLQTKYTKKMADRVMTSKDKGYVSAKDLEIGRMYGDWGNWHVYLGRNSKKEFCWLYCGNPWALSEKGVCYLDLYLRFSIDDLQTTKNNKKIKLSQEFENVYLDLSKLNNTSKTIIAAYTGLIIS